MNKSAQKRNLLIILLIIATLITGVVIYSFNNQPASTSSSQQIKTFQSKNLKLTIEIPIIFQAEERLGRITITSPKGEIYIDRNGTNFGNLNDYLVDLDTHNKKQILQDENKTIGNLEARNRLLKYSSSETQKIYIIFVDNWIYNIYSNTSALFTDLEQMAQSFRYEP